MPDLEQNQETVRAFDELAFNDEKPAEAVARYVGSTYILLETSLEDRGTAAADIFRLEGGELVEHWDVLQPVSEKAANENTMC